MFSLVLFGQEKSPDVKVSRKVNKIVNRIEATNKLHGSSIGRSGMKSKQYILFESLKKSANVQELLALTEHSNAVVRCYSYWAILDIPDIVFKKADEEGIKVKYNTLELIELIKENASEFIEKRTVKKKFKIYILENGDLDVGGS